MIEKPIQDNKEHNNWVQLCKASAVIIKNGVSVDTIISNLKREMWVQGVCTDCPTIEAGSYVYANSVTAMIYALDYELKNNPNFKP